MPRPYSMAAMLRCCVETLEEAYEAGCYDEAVSITCLHCSEAIVLDEEADKFRSLFCIENPE